MKFNTKIMVIILLLIILATLLMYTIWLFVNNKELLILEKKEHRIKTIHRISKIDSDNSNLNNISIKTIRNDYRDPFSLINKPSKKKQISIILKGVMYNSNQVPVAMIRISGSDRTYYKKAGEMISGYKIKKINKRSIEVMYKGNNKTVTIE